MRICKCVHPIALRIYIILLSYVHARIMVHVYIYVSICNPSHTATNPQEGSNLYIVPLPNLLKILKVVSVFPARQKFQIKLAIQVVVW